MLSLNKNFLNSALLKQFNQQLLVVFYVDNLH